jgi:hypothetical protein
MKVDKEKFDGLLGKLMQTPPQERKTIKGEPGNVQPIVSPIPSQSIPRKA